MERFTAYLADEERDGVRQVAWDNRTSANYIIRLAIRRYLGLPVGPNEPAPQEREPA